MRLIISYYIDNDNRRNKELEICLLKNYELKLFDEIIILCEAPIELPFERTKEITQVVIKSRPTFNTFFELINKRKDDWNILANSDIYFDNTIKMIENYSHNIFIALTRWDIVNGQPKFLNRKDSQDVWCFFGKAKVDAEFTMGVPGADNSIAWKFKQQKYQVINPSLTIKTYHMHESGVRNYDTNNRVPQPYH